MENHKYTDETVDLSHAILLDLKEIESLSNIFLLALENNDDTADKKDMLNSMSILNKQFKTVSEDYYKLLEKLGL